jgi:hypothetical protein
MIKINYPSYQPKIRKEQDREFIFDEFRKQWVLLTPEEWVRQNFLQYLIHGKKYPATLIAVEKEIQLGELTKRFDIVVYDRNTNPWMIIECKEMGVNLTVPVLNQALRYNISLDVPFIVITNGSHCYGFSGNKGQLNELTDLPEFGE